MKNPFLDVDNRGLPQNDLLAAEGFEGFARDETMTGGIFDLYYVNITGDTMTGPLVITPTTDDDELLRINDSNGDVIFDVDSTQKYVAIGHITPEASLDIFADSATQALRLRGLADNDLETGAQTAATKTSAAGWVGNVTQLSASDDSRMSTNSAPSNVVIQDFSFTIVGSEISGIEVDIEARHTLGGGNRVIQVEISGDAGATWSDIKSTSILTSSDVVYTLGGSSDLWGYTWTPAMFSNANFRLRFTSYSLPSSATFQVDHITVNVYSANATVSTTRVADLFLNNDGDLVIDSTTGDTIIEPTNNSTTALQVNQTDGTNVLVVDTTNATVNLPQETSAGFVKNTAAGVLSGGNSVDISDDTNLAVSAPILLTGDTLSLDTIDISAHTNLTVSLPITLTGDDLGFDFNQDNTWGGHQTLADGKNIILNTTTGSQIGTASTQKLGFFGATPIVQPTEITDELTTVTHTAPGTPDYAIQDLVDSGVGSAFGFATKDEGNTVLSVIVNNAARIKEIEDALSSLGLLADAD